MTVAHYGKIKLMNKVSFIFPGRLPSLNEFLEQTKRHNGRHFRGNDMKRGYEAQILYCIPLAIRHLHHERRCKVSFDFYEMNKRRDPDNIVAVAHKFILDALVRADVISNDTWKYIKGFTDEFYIDRENPRIEVTIEFLEKR